MSFSRKEKSEEQLQYEAVINNSGGLWVLPPPMEKYKPDFWTTQRRDRELRENQWNNLLCNSPEFKEDLRYYRDKVEEMEKHGKFKKK